MRNEKQRSGGTLIAVFIPAAQIIPCPSSRRKDPDEPADACRVHGSLSLNKVAGNFHVTAGKSLPLMRGHAHLAAMMGERDYNFRDENLNQHSWPFMYREIRPVK